MKKIFVVEAASVFTKAGGHGLRVEGHDGKEYEIVWLPSGTPSLIETLQALLNGEAFVGGKERAGPVALQRSPATVAALKQLRVLEKDQQPGWLVMVRQRQIDLRLLEPDGSGITVPYSPSEAEELASQLLKAAKIAREAVQPPPGPRS